MVAESKEGNVKGEAASSEPTPRTKRKKRTGAAVSIQKGKLLFLPAAFPRLSKSPSDPRRTKRRPATPKGTEGCG
jgi:hypothetical protein